MRIVPIGFPISVNSGGMIDSKVCSRTLLLAFERARLQNPASWDFEIPDVVPGSLNTSVQIYPSPGPYGCIRSPIAEFLSL